MVLAGAWPCAAKYVAISCADAPAVATMTALQSRGWASMHGEETGMQRWSLDGDARALIQIGLRLSPPSLTCELRDDCLVREASNWDLLQMLETRLWKHRKLPEVAKRKELTAFQRGGEKVWYAMPQTFQRLYAVCLLDHACLFEKGVKMIRHAETYET